MQLLFDSKWLRFAIALGHEPESDGSFISNTGGDFDVAPKHDAQDWQYEPDPEDLKLGFTNG
jgi:hypothetical protein